MSIILLNVNTWNIIIKRYVIKLVTKWHTVSKKVNVAILKLKTKSGVTIRDNKDIL